MPHKAQQEDGSLHHKKLIHIFLKLILFIGFLSLFSHFAGATSTSDATRFPRSALYLWEEEYMLRRERA